ncbi:hypothetical protein KC328_g124 [Hortaea werneckii]|nr:hypothetical protein KC328_g124 [Hortaea werneckii]
MRYHNAPAPPTMPQAATIANQTSRKHGVKSHRKGLSGPHPSILPHSGGPCVCETLRYVGNSSRGIDNRNRLIRSVWANRERANEGSGGIRMNKREEEREYPPAAGKTAKEEGRQQLPIKVPYPSGLTNGQHGSLNASVERCKNETFPTSRRYIQLCYRHSFASLSVSLFSIRRLHDGSGAVTKLLGGCSVTIVAGTFAPIDTGSGPGKLSGAFGSRVSATGIGWLRLGERSSWGCSSARRFSEAERSLVERYVGTVERSISLLSVFWPRALSRPSVGCASLFPLSSSSSSSSVSPSVFLRLIAGITGIRGIEYTSHQRIFVLSQNCCTIHESPSVSAAGTGDLPARNSRAGCTAVIKGQHLLHASREHMRDRHSPLCACQRVFALKGARRQHRIAAAGRPGSSLNSSSRSSLGTWLLICRPCSLPWGARTLKIRAKRSTTSPRRMVTAWLTLDSLDARMDAIPSGQTKYLVGIQLTFTLEQSTGGY